MGSEGRGRSQMVLRALPPAGGRSQGTPRALPTQLPFSAKRALARRDTHGVCLGFLLPVLVFARNLWLRSIANLFVSAEGASVDYMFARFAATKRAPFAESARSAFV